MRMKTTFLMSSVLIAVLFMQSLSAWAVHSFRAASDVKFRVELYDKNNERMTVFNSKMNVTGCSSGGTLACPSNENAPACFRVTIDDHWIEYSFLPKELKAVGIAVFEGKVYVWTEPTKTKDLFCNDYQTILFVDSVKEISRDLVLKPNAMSPGFPYDYDKPDA